MPDDELVCGCNGVTKGTIVEAIQKQGLTTLDRVSHCTNAGRSCGRCKPLVSQILAHTLGDQFDAAAANKTSICGCTTLTRGLNQCDGSHKCPWLENVRRLQQMPSGN